MCGSSGGRVPYNGLEGGPPGLVACALPAAAGHRVGLLARSSRGGRVVVVVVLFGEQLLERRLLRRRRGEDERGGRSGVGVGGDDGLAEKRSDDGARGEAEAATVAHEGAHGLARALKRLQLRERQARPGVLALALARARVRALARVLVRARALHVERGHGERGAHLLPVLGSVPTRTLTFYLSSPINILMKLLVFTQRLLKCVTAGNSGVQPKMRKQHLCRCIECKRRRDRGGRPGRRGGVARPSSPLAGGTALSARPLL